MDNVDSEKLTRIFRLKNGDDVISTYIESLGDGTITFINPMLLGKVKSQGTYSHYLIPWLPIDVIENDIAVLYVEDVLVVMVPTEDMINKYIETVFRVLSRMVYDQTDEEFYKEVLEKAEIPNTKH